MYSKKSYRNDVVVIITLLKILLKIVEVVTNFIIYSKVILLL